MTEDVGKTIELMETLGLKPVPGTGTPADGGESLVHKDFVQGIGDSGI